MSYDYSWSGADDVVVLVDRAEAVAFLGFDFWVEMKVRRHWHEREEARIRLEEAEYGAPLPDLGALY